MLTVSNCAMESCNTISSVLVVFVLLLALLFIVDFKAKRALAKVKSEDRKEARRQKRQAKRDNKEVINEDLLKDDEQQ